MKDTKKPADSATAGAEKSQVFTDEERAAMKERVQEQKAAKRRGSTPADAEQEVLAKLAEMPEADRVMGERLHAIVKANAPELSPKTWYGMPGYAKDGKVVCFYQSASKFKARYATFGFNDSANLDDGGMWPVAFALKDLDAAAEKVIIELVRKSGERELTTGLEESVAGPRRSRRCRSSSWWFQGRPRTPPSEAPVA